ncbi:hypothetical protein [Pseudovibrio sp. Ad37]|uniref:hypothetical protein n=1 Tax=Pseudovibrio sp. Ad37 TaxID=989422 RepID=UPI0012906CA7|nr:hypothetical protein [Pseudovibrio sp. Ad37]
MPISNLASSPISSSSEQVQNTSDVRAVETQDIFQQRPDPKPAKDNKTGYFYAPFVSDDVLKMVSGTNLSRFTASK